jgi:Lar family restriction alleviation protein
MPAANYAHKHKLLPCPFCGSGDLTLDNLADPKHGWYVNCNICEIQQIANYTEAQAVALWNRRTNPPDPGAHPDPITDAAERAALGL